MPQPANCNTIILYGILFKIRMECSADWECTASSCFICRITAAQIHPGLSAMRVAMGYKCWTCLLVWPTPRRAWKPLHPDPCGSLVSDEKTHAGQQHLVISPMHGKATQAIALFTKVSTQMNPRWKNIAERSPLKSVWLQVCEHITTFVTGFNCLSPHESHLHLTAQTT